MAISIQCPGCDKTIRAAEKYAGQVAACPGCGNKIRIPELPAVPVQIIEATSKKWKSLQLAAGGIGFVGALVYGLGLLAFTEPANPATYLSLGILFLAAGLAIYARFQAWWHHG